ncbi:Uncharacterized protein Fot_07952 [Forsythia ovata]|uniref:Uncharacterized protein n=1 Tax=Forsythia ovata TaxID=205694 RepID=A0ABD1X088_9LAMI
MNSIGNIDTNSNDTSNMGTSEGSVPPGVIYPVVVPVVAPTTTLAFVKRGGTCHFLLVPQSRRNVDAVYIISCPQWAGNPCPQADLSACGLLMQKVTFCINSPQADKSACGHEIPAHWGQEIRTLYHSRVPTKNPRFPNAKFLTLRV